MPGKVFAVVVVIVTLVITYCVIAHVWWMPEDISVHGPKIDHQIEETLLGAGILFIAGQLVLAAFSFLYGDSKGARKMKAFPGGAKPLIIFACVVVGIEVLVLSFVGSKAWGSVYFAPPDPDSLRVDVQAGQFAFYFRYPGPDGKFGPTHVEKVDDAAGNFYGLDREHDAASRDDIVTATLAVPVDRPVELILRSKDVTHSFFVRELRLKQDAVPGMEIPIHFTTTEDALEHNGGRYEIACTQLCGLGHYRMRAFLQVMTEANFEKWLKTQAAEQ
jgi:cytochrome c oxidase subunit II